MPVPSPAPMSITAGTLGGVEAHVGHDHFVKVIDRGDCLGRNRADAAAPSEDHDLAHREKLP